MASLSDWTAFLAASGGMHLARTLSPQGADRLAVRLGTLAYRLMASRRRSTFENLQRAFGTEYNQTELEALTLRVFQNVARSLIEVSRFPKVGKAAMLPLIHGNGIELLDRVHGEGKGAILLTAHFGNWELMGSWVSLVGYPMDFLVGIQHNSLVDELFNDCRRAMGVGVIKVGSPRQVMRGLKENRFMGLAADQHAPTGGMVINFFGRPASFARGPAVFALRAGCPLLPFLLRRESYDKHVLMPGEPIYPQASGDEESEVRRMTIRYAQFLQSKIREYPDQWMWTHRRWKLDLHVSGNIHSQEEVLP